MIKTALRSLAVVSMAALAACNGSGVQPAPERTEEAQAASPAATPASPAKPLAQETPAAPVANSGENDGSPDITPAKLTGDAAKTEKGARAVLLAWARGIELREFDQAWNLMGDAARQQTSKSRFNALFHPLRDITVAVPGGDMEGAAGSSYYTVPTTVTGTRMDGSQATLKGEVVLRRVNDVPGATAAQLAWHIERVTLEPA